MAGSKFSITITAVDKATAVVRGINRDMGNLVRPARNFAQTTRQFGTAVWANPAVKGIRNVGNAAWWATSKVSGMLSPFSSMAGIFAGGSVAAVATGVLSMAEAWGKAGQNLSFVSRRSGVAVKNVQALRGAADLAGVGADSMDASLVSLGDKLQDISYGRDANGANLLAQLGIQIKRNDKGVVDTEQALKDIADAIQRAGNPQKQALIAKQLGLEELLPLLRDGSAGMDRLIDRAYQLGLVNKKGADDASKLGKSFNELTASFKGFETAVGNSAVGGHLAGILNSATNLLAGGSHLLTRGDQQESLAGFSRKGLDFAANFAPIPYVVNRLVPKYGEDFTRDSSTLSGTAKGALSSFSGSPSTKLANSAFGNLISKGEGNYNSVNLGRAGGNRSSTADLENMTVAQVMAAQRSRRFNAAGRYQLIPSTLKEAAEHLGLTGQEKFDANTQDRILDYIIHVKRPQIGAYLDRKSDDRLAAELAGSQEWASFANPYTGISYYPKNNRASISAAQQGLALDATRQQLAPSAADIGTAVADAMNKNPPHTVIVKVEAAPGLKVTQQQPAAGQGGRIGYSMTGNPA